jgi:pimeloyl-ACP methyl ester carboxylesterase
VSNLELLWEEPVTARFLRRLCSFARLILLDKRGTGLSDRVTQMPSLEVRMDDVRAVMDAVGSQRAALLGISEGGAMCMLFASTYPERTQAVVIVGGFARRVWAPDHPWGPTHDAVMLWVEQIEREWGGPVGLDERAPSAAHDPHVRDWWARFLRLSSSPKAGADLIRVNADIDVRHVLNAIRVPTLVVHNRSDKAVDVGCGRYIASQVPGARFVELNGIDHLPYFGNSDEVLAAVEEFLTGVAPPPDPDRVLATVMFTDIVDSTTRAATLGDRRWHELLESHHALVRHELARHRGREVDTAGDGFLAAFDGPARAVRCALAIVEGVRAMGLQLRASVHTGEYERMGEKLTGLSVHIGARVAALAGAGEVLTSSTVKDLVAGSGLRFAERGSHALKGVPGHWQIFAAS